MFTTKPPISIIEAPLVSEEYFSGVSLMSKALLNAHLDTALQAKVSARLPEPDWQPQRDEKIQILNPAEVAEYSIRLASTVQNDLALRKFPVVLGGDCTILIGCMLAAKRHAQAGLFFIDGHADYYPPGISPSGETADMELGLVTGTGPEILTDIEGQRPLVPEEHTVLFGFRDEDMIKQAGGTDVRKSQITCVSLADTRLFGFHNCLERSIQTLLGKVNKFWIHLDLDVLDDALMPAVDYRMPDGFSAGELVSTLSRLTDSGKALGISVSIFNPSLDWDRSLAGKVVKYLRAGLTDLD